VNEREMGRIQLSRPSPVLTHNPHSTGPELRQCIREQHSMSHDAHSPFGGWNRNRTRSQIERVCICQVNICQEESSYEASFEFVDGQFCIFV
jgi:hypothetical protein